VTTAWPSERSPGALKVASAPDLLARAAELVDIGSESGQEAELVAHLERQLADVAGLELIRVGDNLVARTDRGHRQRLVLAGHTDTVPANGNVGARIEGDTLHGLGAADMKGGLAVMVELARTVSVPAIDLTFVFYAREEVAAERSGLGELVGARPDLLVGDAALLGEPTSAGLEAGCQGTLRLRVTLTGERAHPARPWMGRNAVHRSAPLVAAVAAAPLRQPLIDGCQFREAMQVLAIEGGVAGNVVPDRVVLTINHRFAPDRSADEAEAYVRALIAPWLEAGDDVIRVDAADGAMPAITHPLIRTLVERHHLPVVAKLGWTDVARFAQLGIPAANFGPGDPTIAHTADEYVTRAELDRVFGALDDLIRSGSDRSAAP
jgi:succinyl-diaminopimelate desuccinylase